MPTATIKNFLVLPLQKIDMVNLFKEALEKKEDTVFILNYEQLDKGKDAGGKSLGRYSNFKYKNRYEPVDLLLTGDWRGKFTLAVKEKNAEIFSQDEKDNKLHKRYGKDITGLDHISKQKLADVIKPYLGELFKKSLGL